MKTKNLPVKSATLLKKIQMNQSLLFMIAIPVLYIFITKYLTMIGVVIAFKDVNFTKGIFRSDWVGFDNFHYLFATKDAFVITRNTLLYNRTYAVAVID